MYVGDNGYYLCLNQLGMSHAHFIFRCNIYPTQQLVDDLVLDDILHVPDYWLICLIINLV